MQDKLKIAIVAKKTIKYIEKNIENTIRIFKSIL